MQGYRSLSRADAEMSSHYFLTSHYQRVRSKTPEKDLDPIFALHIVQCLSLTIDTHFNQPVHNVCRFGETQESEYPDTPSQFQPHLQHMMML